MMDASDLDLRSKLAQQDAALQAMAQHLDKFKDFELESSVKNTEELAQAMEIQNQLRLRNDSLLRTVENQAHTIELMLMKRMQLIDQVEEAQDHSKRLRVEYEEQLSSGEAAYRVLEGQLLESKSELHAAHTTISSLQSQLESDRQQLAKANSALEDRASTLVSECSTLRAQLKNMESVNEQLSKELDSNQTLLGESEEQVLYLKSEVSSINSELEKLKIEYNKTCATLSSVQSQCQQYANDRERVSVESKTLSANLDQLQNQVHNLESDNARLQQDCASYCEMISALELELDSSNNNCNILTTEISETKSRNSSLSSSNENMTVVLKKNEQALEQAQLSYASISKLNLLLKEQLNNGEAAYTALEDQLLESKSELQAAHTTIHNLQSQLDTNIQQLAKANSALEDRASTLVSECSTLRAQLKNMESVNEQLSKELDSNQTLLGESEEQVLYLKSEVSSINSELEKLKIEYNKTCATLSSVQSQCQQYANDRERVSVESKTLSANLDQLQNQVHNLESDNARLQQDCASYCEIISALELELDSSNNNCNTLTAEISEIKSRNSSLSSLNENLTVALKNNEQALEQAQTALRDSNSNSLKEAKRMSTTFEEMYNRDLQSQSELIQNYTAKLKEAEDLLAASNERFQVFKRDSFELEQTLIRRVQEAENALRSSEERQSKEIESIRSSYDHDLNELRHDLESLKMHHRKELEILKKRYDSELDRTMNEVESRYSKEIRDHVQKIANYADQVHELELALKNSQDSHEAIKRDLSELEVSSQYRAHENENAIAISESRCSQELQSIRTSYENELLKTQSELQSLDVAYVHDMAYSHDPRCEKCGGISYLPIYCHRCASSKQQLVDTEHTQALHQWNRAHHNLQDEVTQLRSCLNKAAAAITELEIRLQEAYADKLRIQEDCERVKDERNAYVSLLQESVTEIQHMEETERDLRNAHRSVDEELHRSKVLLIGEGRAKQIFSRRLRMLQDTLQLTRAELQQYKLDVARLNTLNKKYLLDLEQAQEALSAAQGVSPKQLQSQISALENELTSSRLHQSEAQERLASCLSELQHAQSDNEMLRKALSELNVVIRRRLRGVLHLVPHVKTFIKDFMQGEERTLSNQFHSLLKLISLGRNSALDLRNYLQSLQERDLLQSQALARAGRQLKEFQLVLGTQATQIQFLKQQLRQSETSAVISNGHSAYRGFEAKRLPSERDIT